AGWSPPATCRLLPAKGSEKTSSRDVSKASGWMLPTSYQTCTWIAGRSSSTTTRPTATGWLSANDGYPHISHFLPGFHIAVRVYDPVKRIGAVYDRAECALQSELPKIHGVRPPHYRYREKYPFVVPKRCGQCEQHVFRVFSQFGR